MSDLNQHYVYLYRDKLGKPLYVGYGAKALRSAAHFGESAHNAALKKKLKESSCTLEIAGPFGDEKCAKAVETALISAFQLNGTLTNVNKGHHNWRFRRLGVPNEFIGRIDEDPLTMEKWKGFARREGGIIFVRINDQELDDGRPGDLLANVPTDRDISARMDRWWQLYSYASKEWVKKPMNSPGLLVALGGVGAMRLVIASLAIDKCGWEQAVDERQPNGLLYIPHERNLKKLDASCLRGRRVDPSTGLNFGRLRHEVFIIMDIHGHIVKGGKKSGPPNA